MNDPQEQPTPLSALLDNPQAARTHTRWSGLLASQVFWVVAATIVACVVLSFVTSTFATPQNLFNVTRNFGMVKDKHKHGAPAKATLISATYADGPTWTSP